MNKLRLLILLSILIPGCAFACSSRGYTIVYVNGVFTTVDQADEDVRELKGLLDPRPIDQGVTVLTGYNPIHLDGLGDVLESISQAFNMPVSNYDLENLLVQIASNVFTRKLLLVGHSQGSFYTNEIYDYLVQHGVASSSIAVYNIATPADRVAGGGTYLTSANDSVINYVRQMDASWGLPQALPANILIPPKTGDDADPWGGHSSSVYFTGARSRIISDILKLLRDLIVVDKDTIGACIASPTFNASYAVQGSLFGLADPLTTALGTLASNTGSAAAAALSTANEKMHTAFTDAVFSVLPRPTVQNATGVFAVEKALYGSSLSVADYEALLKGEDVPEVRPTQVQTHPQREKNATGSVEPLDATTSTSSTVTSIRAIEPTPAATPTMPGSELIPITPGFGGGGSARVEPPQVVPAIVAQVQATNAATSTASSASSTVPSATSSPQNTGTADASSTAATSTEVVSSSATSSQPIATSSTEIAVQASAISPVADTFDAGFAGWSSYPQGWATAAWSTSTTDCYSGNCLSETELNRLYQNIKSGTSLVSWSFLIYFRNHNYNGQFGVGVCMDLSVTSCENPNNAGGANALLFYRVNSYWDDLWHYLYFAFRDGTSGKEYCGLVDDSSSTDCEWRTTAVPNGTTYSGVIFSTDDGLLPGASFYWDELGTTTRSAGQGVQ